ncbi:hypothetical protein HUN03_00353 [Mycoplasmopsis anatis]|uniref:Uncharacterized protein n=1 Tax=Mycoplasmopsis anatis TaxID=171279 RepID=A0A9Q3QE73_9BACT|nr:hypothetical protein [Mycoplasmopsis anatis]MBW0595314.1 hypothetical protein [Mycoplasmopsis anatis]MBW0598380.1 hypothetical protein [Mycoplasmopsis anatis]MBW0601849.1 hypothetical protein [Mycoplasmopsis anatis]MBW0602505.1 hypothetical protein [Mycoplasmopsis anatis]MBW0604122.1 hypothetical protein [Mycoplasmopsis anatis]
MLNNKKIKTISTSSIIAGAIVSALGLSVVSALHSKNPLDTSVKVVIKEIIYNIDNSGIIKNKDVLKQFEDLLEKIDDKNVGIEEKIDGISNSSVNVLEDLINNFPSKLSKEQAESLGKILNNLSKFISENDLRSEFVNRTKSLISNIVINSQNEDTSQNAKNELIEFKNLFLAQIEKQKILFKPYIDFINGIIGSDENKLELNENNKIYFDYQDLLLSKELNLNTLETLKQQILIYNTSENNLIEFNKLKNSVDSLLNDNKQLEENPDSELVSIVEKELLNNPSFNKLEMLKKLLLNNLTNYSDSRKNTNQVKSSFKDILNSNNLTVLREKFISMQTVSPDAIEQINELDELVKLKNKYLDDLAAFEYAEKIHKNVNEYLSKIVPNLDISNTDYNKLTNLNRLSNFTDLSTVEEIKKYSEELEKLLKNVQFNTITTNKLTDQIYSDLEFFNNSNLKTSQNELNNALINEKLSSYKNAVGFDSFTSSIYAKVLEEQLRQNSKALLVELEQKANNKKSELEKYGDTTSKALMKFINDIIEDSLKLSSTYSPSTTNQIKDFISNFNFLSVVDQFAKGVNDAIIQNDKVSTYADQVFPSYKDKTDPFYINSKAELDNIKNYLDSLKNNLDSLNDHSKANEILEEIKKVQEKQQNILENLEKRKAVNDLIDDFDINKNLIDDLMDVVDKIAPKLEQLKKEIDDLNSKLENPNLTPEESDELMKKTEEKIKEHHDLINDAIIDNEIDKTKEFIDSKYPDDGNRDNDSDIEKSIRDEFERIKEKIKKPDLSNIDRDKLISEFDELKATTNSIKNLEDARAKLIAAIQNANSTPHDKFTDMRLESGDRILEQIDQILNSLNSTPKPTINQIDDISNLADKQSELIYLALKQDQVVIANKKLQSNKLDTDNNDYEIVSDAYNQVYAYANEKAKSDNYDELNKAVSKLEHLNKLAPWINKLFEFSEGIKPGEDGSNKEFETLYDHAIKLLDKVNLNIDKTDEQINETIDEIKSNLEVFELKKQLYKENNKLDEILNDKQKTQALYDDIKREIQAQKEYNEQLINSPFETSTSINSAILASGSKYNELVNKRDLNTKIFDDKVNDIKNRIEQISKEISQKENQLFNNFGKAKDKFENEVFEDINKTINNYDMTLSKLNNYLTEINRNYEKDKALNVIKELKDFIDTSKASGELSKNNLLDDELKIYKSFDDLINYLSDEVNSNPAANYEEIIDKARLGLDLANYEINNVVKAIANLSQKDDSVNGYENLKKALKDNLPTIPFTNLDIKLNKIKDLVETILDLENYRSLVADLIGENGSTESNSNHDESKYTGKYKEILDKFKKFDINNKPIIDQEIFTTLKEVLNDKKQENINAKTKNDIRKIQDFLDERFNNQRLGALQELSKQVQNELNRLEEINAETNPTIKEFLDRFKPSIDKNINDSRDLYNSRMGVIQINNKANSLKQHLETLNYAKEIAKKVDLLSKNIGFDHDNPTSVNNSDKINYFTLDGISGSVKNQQWTNWLSAILNNYYLTNNNVNAKDNYDAIVSLLRKTEILFAKQKEISKIIQSRYDSANKANGFEGNTTDATYLTNYLWNSVPTEYSSKNNDPKAWEEFIDQQIKQLDSAKLIESENNKSRNEINDLINQFKSDKDSIFGTSDYIKLHKELTLRIDQLDNLNKQNLDITKFSKIRSDVQDLINIEDKLKFLANRIIDANKAIRQIESNSDDENNLSKDPEVASNIQSIKENILIFETKYKTYNSDTPATGKVDVESDIQKLNSLLVELEYKANKAEFRNTLLQNLVLEKKEKDILSNLLEKTQEEFNNTDKSYEQYIEIYKKYFLKSNDRPELGSIDHKNNLYSIFNSAVQLKEKVQESEILSLFEIKDPTSLIDSKDGVNSTKNAYAELNQSINLAKELLVQPKTDNTETAKKEVIKQLEAKIIKLMNAKSTDIDRFKQLAQNILTFVNRENKQNALNSNFEQRTITELNEVKNEFNKSISNRVNNTVASDDLTIDQVNLKLKEVYKEVQNQTKLLFEAYREELENLRDKVQNYYNEFSDINTRKAAEVSQDSFEKLNIEINNSANSATLKTFTSDEIVNFENTINTKFKNNIAQLNNALSSFTNEFINGTKKYLAPSSGLFNKFDAFISPFVKNTATSHQDLFVNAEFNKSSVDYSNNYKVELDTILHKYNQVLTSTDAAYLANFGAEFTKLRESYLSLITNLKEEALKFISTQFRGDLSEILNEMSSNPNSFGFDKVKGKYQLEIDKINNNLTSLNNKSSDVDNAITNLRLIFDNIHSLYNWTNIEENNKLFFDYLESSISNTVRYQYVKPKVQARKNDFLNDIETIKPKDPNVNEIDITESNIFLSLFDEFAFTKLGIKNESALFNINNVRVILVKDGSEWTKVTTNSTDINNRTQVVQIKLKYIYTPNNLSKFKNQQPISVIKNVRIQFNTVNDIKIASGTSNLFYQEKNGKLVYGQDAKVEILDLASSGLMDVAESKSDPIGFVYNKFKANVLNSKEKLIITPEIRKTSAYKNSELAYMVDIQTQTNNSLDQNISTSAQYENRYTIIFGDDSDKTINIINVMPGNFDNNFSNDNTWFLAEYGGIVERNDLTKAMPNALVNYIRIKLTNDSNKMYAHIDHLQNAYVSKVYNFEWIPGQDFDIYDIPGGSTSIQGSTRIVWTPDKLAKYVVSNYKNVLYNENDRRLYTTQEDGNYGTQYTRPLIQSNIVILPTDSRSEAELLKNGSKHKDFNYRSGAIYITNGRLSNNLTVNQSSVIFNSGIENFKFNFRK